MDSNNAKMSTVGKAIVAGTALIIVLAVALGMAARDNAGVPSAPPTGNPA
jgi:hypothetical protein